MVKKTSSSRMKKCNHHQLWQQHPCIHGSYPSCSSLCLQWSRGRRCDSLLSESTLKITSFSYFTEHLSNSVSTLLLFKKKRSKPTEKEIFFWSLFSSPVKESHLLFLISTAHWSNRLLFIQWKYMDKIKWDVTEP